MKRSILLICFLYGLSVNAQTIQKYYDWQWLPCEAGLARFIGLTTYTDSGWLAKDYFVSTKKLQMKGVFRDSARKIKNGWFSYFYSNGNLSEIGRFVNNEREGLWLSFHYNSMISDSTVYDLGIPRGTSMGWHSNGFIADSSEYNREGRGIQVYWFDNGVPSITGRTLNNRKDGKWQYFHKNGNLSALEEYLEGKLINKTYYNEEGKELTDTSNKDREAEFKGGKEKWQKFLLKKLVWPRNVNLVNTDIITVVVSALVDEDGNITETYIEVPFAKEFDDEALYTIRRSPKWIPAISHNRRVKMYIRQAISFSQQHD